MVKMILKSPARHRRVRLGHAIRRIFSTCRRGKKRIKLIIKVVQTADRTIDMHVLMNRI